jgi:general stress protein 26
MQDEEKDAVEKLGELLKGIRFAMLTTEDGEGFLRSRPMATRELGEDGTLWFFTERAPRRSTRSAGTRT